MRICRGQKSAWTAECSPILRQLRRRPGPPIKAAATVRDHLPGSAALAGNPRPGSSVGHLLIASQEANPETAYKIYIQ